jgi:hypothetical protein
MENLSFDFLPVHRPGGVCRWCPNSQFLDGTPACRETLDLVFLAPGELFPSILVVSPASIAPVRKYVMGLWKFYGVHPSAVVTEIGLERATSRTGIVYSRLTLRMVHALPAVQQVKMREVVAAFGFGTKPNNDAVGTVDVGSDDAPPPTDDDVPF